MAAPLRRLGTNRPDGTASPYLPRDTNTTIHKQQVVVSAVVKCGGGDEREGGEDFDGGGCGDLSALESRELMSATRRQSNQSSMPVSHSVRNSVSQSDYQTILQQLNTNRIVRNTRDDGHGEVAQEEPPQHVRRKSCLFVLVRPGLNHVKEVANGSVGRRKRQRCHLIELSFGAREPNLRASERHEGTVSAM